MTHPLTAKFTRHALLLGAADRRRLADVLVASLTPTVTPGAPERLHALVEAMEGIVGMSLATRARLRQLVDARYIVAYTASREGFTQEEVAEALGLDHSTLSYGIRRVADTLATPEAGRDLIQLYNQFTQKI